MLEAASYDYDTLNFKAVRSGRSPFSDANSFWNASSTCRNGTDGVELSPPEFISATAPMPSDGMQSRMSILGNLLKRVLLVVCSHLQSSPLLYTRNGNLYWKMHNQSRIPHWRKKEQHRLRCTWIGVSWAAANKWIITDGLRLCDDVIILLDIRWRWAWTCQRRHRIQFLPHGFAIVQRREL